MKYKLKSWLITFIIIMTCAFAIHINLMGEFILFLLGLLTIYIIAYYIEDFLNRIHYK
jgi:purine-cytosine permease-like protein